MSLYSHGKPSIEPPSVARCMIDTYRGMNKHFIPTGNELQSFAKYLFAYNNLINRVFDRDIKGYITEDDLIATATRLFLANNNSNKSQNVFR